MSANQSIQGQSSPIGKGIGTMVVFLGIVGGLLFSSYGSFNWWEAWLLLGLWATYFVLMLTVVRKINPGVVEERSESLEKFGQRWDKIIIAIYMVTTIILYIIAGMDVGRFGWTGEVPDWVKWGALPLVLVAYVLPMWSVIANPYASGAVRIQEERGHYAVAKGPYKLVRHPFYLGTVIFGISFPLFLESYWALIPGLIVLAILVGFLPAVAAYRTDVARSLSANP